MIEIEITKANKAHFLGTRKYKLNRLNIGSQAENTILLEVGPQKSNQLTLEISPNGLKAKGDIDLFVNSSKVKLPRFINSGDILKNEKFELKILNFQNTKIETLKDFTTNEFNEIESEEPELISVMKIISDEE